MVGHSVAPPKRKSPFPCFELLQQCYIILLPLPVSPWTDQTWAFQLPTLHECLGLCALCFQILMLELHWPVRWYLEMGSFRSSPDRINALLRRDHRKPFPLSLPRGDVVRVSILTSNGLDRQLNLGFPSPMAVQNQVSGGPNKLLVSQYVLLNQPEWQRQGCAKSSFPLSF